MARARVRTRSPCKAAKALAPATAKRTPQEPWTKGFIIELHSQLDLNTPLDAAVFACLTTTFYSASRLGEFTQKKLKNFDPKIHVSPKDVRADIDRHGNRSTVFHLPYTKSAQYAGEDVSWARQDDSSDPEAAYENHRKINSPPDDHPLFAYRYRNS
jgi:hypothetical protein